VHNHKRYNVKVGKVISVFSKLRLAGDVLRQSENRPANVAVNWIPTDGKRAGGRSQNTWRTTFSEDVHSTGIDWRGTERMASNT